MAPTTIQARLDEICADQGVPLGHGKMRGLGRVLGISGSRVSQIYAGAPTLRLGEESITRLATLGYSPAWVQEGRGNKRLSGNISTQPRPIIAVDDDTPLSDDEVEVPRLTLKLSAGSGRLNWEIDEKGTPNRFRRSWCKKKRISPESLVTIVIDGDSMSPGIPDGASVVINTAKTDIRTGKRHAIDYLGEFFIKRLFKQPDGSIVVRSDNPDKAIYPDWVITPEHGETLRILGRPESVAADTDD